ncbi:MAG: hypothetical protein NTW10_14300 [Bacteroidetes bacterium]|nr:hypothetical protein [Bacteroidota bacterium]
MKLWIKIVLALAVAGIAAVFFIVHFVVNKPHPDIEKMNPDYTLDAGKFYKEFRTSKQNAHKLYNGKVIEISGKLNRVESVDTMTIAVFVFNQGMFGEEGIRCTMLKKFSPEVKKLKSDGVVRIKGYCTGATETDVIMEKCSLIY